MKLNDVMVRNVITAAPDDTLAEAAKKMRNAEIGCLVVTKGTRVIGIITDRDLAVRCLCSDDAPQTCKVSKHMSEPVITATPDTDALDALSLMTRSEIKRLPVVEKGVLVGLVSFSDLAQSLKQPITDLLLGMGAARRTA